MNNDNKKEDETDTSDGILHHSDKADMTQDDADTSFTPIFHRSKAKTYIHIENWLKCLFLKRMRNSQNIKS